MSWPQLAAEHVGHRATLKDDRHLRCLDCSVTLVLPREHAGTPTPEPYRRPQVAAVPMPTGMKERVLAEVEARKAARQEQTS